MVSPPPPPPPLAVLLRLLHLNFPHNRSSAVHLTLHYWSSVWSISPGPFRRPFLSTAAKLLGTTTLAVVQRLARQSPWTEKVTP